MLTFIGYLYASLAIIPPISFSLLYAAIYRIRKQKKLALDISTTASSILFTSNITAMHKTIGGNGTNYILWWMVALIILLVAALSIMQNKNGKKADNVKNFRLASRFVFVLLAILYATVFVVGLIYHL